MIQCLEEWDGKKAPVAERWVQIFSKMEAEEIQYDVILKVLK
jgi:hypothetical protein